MAKTAFKSMHNWRRYPSSNCDKIDQKCGSKFGALLWHHLPPEKNRNIGAQLQFLLYTSAKKYLGKFTSYMTFGAHKLVHSEPFLDSRCEIWQLLPALYSEVQKKLYRCTSTFLALKYYSVFFKISQLSIRSGAHKLFCQFLNFSQFYRNFPKIVALPSDGNAY